MSKVKYHYTATISQRSEDMTGLGGGTLIVGITYIIGIYSEGDDFSNIANVISGDINKTGCIFIATGTNPTNWTNGTLIRSYGNPWATFLDSNLENPTWKYITDNRYYLQTNKLIDPVKTSVNMGIRVDIEETDEPITSSYFFSDNFTVNSLFNSGVNSDPNGFNDKKTHAINEHPTVLDIIPFKEVYKGEVVEGIIIGGIFDSYLGDTCFCLVKLKSDGSIFSNFNGGIDYTGRGALGPNHRYTFQVRSIKPQRDGKLLIGGVIGSYNGTDIVSCLIRINTDETLDTTFKVDGFDGITDLVNTIAIQNDGKILVGGEFNSYDGYRSGSIIRLNSDGTVDNTFNNQNIGFNDSVNIIVIQQDGKILVGGQFDNYNDEYCAYLVRLNSNGSLDTTFMSKYDNIFDGDVNKIVIESDGSILVGGDFSGQNNSTGTNGASGGGGNGSGNGHSGGTASGAGSASGASISFLGNAGGFGGHAAGGGGGGGAGGGGGSTTNDNSSFTGANGGSGYTWINGGTYAGGGGGGGGSSGSTTNASGGSGQAGGGNGSNCNAANAGSAGNNTGSGGGGGGGITNPSNGGNGGSGIVILAFN